MPVILCISTSHHYVSALSIHIYLYAWWDVDTNVGYFIIIVSMLVHPILKNFYLLQQNITFIDQWWEYHNWRKIFVNCRIMPDAMPFKLCHYNANIYTPRQAQNNTMKHGDVITWKRFSHYCNFVDCPKNWPVFRTLDDLCGISHIKAQSKNRWNETPCHSCDVTASH